jgi:hypothetical protein
MLYMHPNTDDGKIVIEPRMNKFIFSNIYNIKGFTG